MIIAWFGLISQLPVDCQHGSIVRIIMRPDVMNPFFLGKQGRLQLQRLGQCWGHNGYSQLGNGLLPQSTVPGNVSGLTSGVAAVDAGDFHSCAVTTGGGA